MSNRTLYISRECQHCKKLLIGVHKYEFLGGMFIFVDVNTQQYPDYINSVPTLVVDQNMIKGEDVFGYMNNMVEQVFQQHPELKQKYHPAESQQGQQGQQQGQQQQGQGQQQDQQGPQQSQQAPQQDKGADYDPVDDLVGWCPDGGCSFSEITEQSDDCSKQLVSLDGNPFAIISEENDQLSPQTTQKIPLEKDNTSFQKSAKQQQMDSSYERLMAERNLMK